MKIEKFLALVVAFGFVQAVFAGPFVGGRDIPEGRDFSFNITAGSIVDIEGEVQETNRRYYDVTGQSEKQNLREDYSLEDFGMDGGYELLGFSLENAGHLWTLQWDLSIMNPQVNSVADRNYYIGVSGVSYGGQDYEYMQIPEGTSFSVDMFAMMTEVRGLFTPFTFKPGNNFRFTPFVDIGLFVFYGSYDIDAGPAQGVIQYLNPPEDFVVGGQASGQLVVAVPELGAGAELRIGSPKGPNLVLQGNYAVLEYDGSTEFLLSSDHRAKDLNLSHINMKLRGSLELPLKEGRSLALGLQYHYIETDAEITSSDDFSDEEAADRHERFDKDVFFSMNTIMATLGFTF
ncbi:MAG: hypothetical protein KAH23_09915 [Kiritimatiellae bacterium]|nr:hypothetical protein [Kiritimatiellia bacterium]